MVGGGRSDGASAGAWGMEHLEGLKGLRESQHVSSFETPLVKSKTFGHSSCGYFLPIQHEPVGAGSIHHMDLGR